MSYEAKYVFVAEVAVVTIVIADIIARNFLIFILNSF